MKKEIKEIRNYFIFHGHNTTCITDDEIIKTMKDIENVSLKLKVTNKEQITAIIAATIMKTE